MKIPKTVFVLRHIYYTGSFGVFTTRAKAEAFADKISAARGRYYQRTGFRISEEPLDRASL